MKNKNIVTLFGITFAIVGLLSASTESFAQVSIQNGSQSNLGVVSSQPGSQSGSHAGLQSSTQTKGPQNNTGVSQTNSSITQGGVLNNQTVTIESGTGSAGANSACANAKNCFNPGVINAQPGSSVTWTNKDNVIHTVTSGKSSDTDVGKLFDKNIPMGKSISLQFNNTGTIDYFCKVHPWMAGQISVGSVNSSGTQGGTLGPSSLTNNSTNGGLNQPSSLGPSQPNTSPSGNIGNVPGSQVNPNTSVPGP